MFTVYNSEYRRRYYAPICSFSTLCCLIAFLATIVLSFFIPFATKQFWIKSGLHYEQPIIKYRGEFYIALTDKDSVVYEYSTYNAINQKANNVLQTFIEYSNEDTNSDGIIDVIKVKAIIDLPTDSNAYSFNHIDLAIGLNYELNHTTKISMKSGFFISFDIPLGAGQIYSIGDLILSQRAPIKVHSNRNYPYNSESIFDPLLTGDYIDALNLYNKRNETLEYRMNTITSPTVLKEVIVDLTMHVPTHQEVAYELSMEELLKEGWLQYLYLFIPIYFIVYKIVMWALVRYKVMNTKIREDELLTG